MADVSKAIEVIFAGVDDMSGTVAKVGGSINDFSGNLQSATEPLANFGKDVLALEAALTALAVGGLAMALNKSGEFGDSFAEISTLINAPTDQIANFKNEVLEYSQSSTQSLEAITGAVYQAISATGDWQHATDLLNVSEQLAVGGVTDLETATKLLATTMNSYGEKDLSKAIDYSDTFFNIVRDGVTTIPELSNTIGQVSTIAATAGIDFETLGAAISAMTGYNVNTAQTMTQLRQAIAAIIAPTEATRAAAKELGIDIGQAAIDSKGFPGVLQDIYDKTGGSLEKIKLLIPSIEGANAVMILGSDSAGKFADALKHQADNAGATTDAFNKMKDNFNLINQQMANNFNALLVLIGDKITESYAGLTDGVIGILQALATEVEKGTFDPIFQKIDELSGQMTTKLQEIAKNIPAAFANIDLSGLITSFEALSKAGQGLFLDFFGDIDLTTPEGLSIAIQKIVDSLQTLNEVSTGIIDALRPFVQVLGEVFDEVNDLSPATKDLLGQIMGFAIGITPLIGILGTFGLAIEGGALAVKGLSKAFNAGDGLTASMGGFASKLGEFLILWETFRLGQEIGTSLYENNTLGIRSMADGIANWVGNLVTGIDTEKGLNSVLTAGTNLTKEQIEAWKARTAALKETPTEVSTKFGIQYDEADKILQFIVKAADTGQTTAEIMASLRAEYADTETAKVLDWAQLEAEVKKWVGLDVKDPAAVQAAIAAAVKANAQGIVSFPASLDMETDKAALAVNELILQIEKDWNDAGLEIKTPELTALKEELKKIAYDSANDWNVAFQGVGGDMVTEFNAVTGEIKYVFEHTANSLKDTLTDPVKTEIDDVYKAALEKKETIESALKYRAEVDIKQFEEQTEQIKIKADFLQTALQIKGDIDIANLENISKTLDVIGISLESSADIITTSVGALVEIGDKFGAFSPQMDLALAAIQHEINNREKEVKQLEKLTKAQVEYLQAKTEALKSGDGIIRVEADGLEPELEMIMWKIIEKVQVRATENVDQFLLGLP